LSGAPAPPSLVPPVRDDGVRVGRPAARPELGWGREMDARLSLYEDLILRVSRVAQQRSAAASRPPSPMVLRGSNRVPGRTRTGTPLSSGISVDPGVIWKGGWIEWSASWSR
jgi:hypothetical protein